MKNVYLSKKCVYILWDSLPCVKSIILKYLSCCELDMHYLCYYSINLSCIEDLNIKITLWSEQIFNLLPFGNLFVAPPKKLMKFSFSPKRPRRLPILGENLCTPILGYPHPPGYLESSRNPNISNEMEQRWAQNRYLKQK